MALFLQETDHLLLQASLKGELEASQQQVEVYKIQLAEMTSEKHKIHEHLKTSAEQHQRTLSAYQQRVVALQEESRAAKVCPSGLNPWGSSTLGYSLAVFCN